MTPVIRLWAQVLIWVALLPQFPPLPFDLARSCLSVVSKSSSAGECGCLLPAHVPFLFPGVLWGPPLPYSHSRRFTLSPRPVPQTWLINEFQVQQPSDRLREGCVIRSQPRKCNSGIDWPRKRSCFLLMGCWYCPVLQLLSSPHRSSLGSGEYS